MQHRVPLATTSTTAHLYTRPSELDSLRDEWGALYRCAVGVTPFQSPAWLIPWYEVWGHGRTHVLAVRDAADTLTGIVPALQSTATGSLELGGSGVGDYLAPLVGRDAGDATVTACDKAVESFTCAFHDMPTGLPWPSVDHGWTAERGSCCQAITLPDSVTTFRNALSSGLRRNLRRYREQLERQGTVQFATANAPAVVADVLECLFDLHTACWRSRGRPGVLSNEDVRQFHRLAVPALHAEGLLRLHYLSFDGTISAVVYVLIDRGRALSYIGGFDPALDSYSPGSLLLAYAIESAIEEGCRSYDFLRGTETYKRAWGAVEHSTVNFSRVGVCSAF